MNLSINIQGVNRRIGKAMAVNGSPAPVFETNEQSTPVLVTLPVHSLTEINKSDQASNQAQIILNDQVPTRAQNQLINAFKTLGYEI